MKTSRPDSPYRAFTMENGGPLNLHPEAVSLLYEELFDSKQNGEGHCYLPSYLPERVEEDTGASSDEDAEGFDVTSEEEASETQTLSDDCGTAGGVSGNSADAAKSRSISEHLNDLDLEKAGGSSEADRASGSLQKVAGANRRLLDGDRPSSGSENEVKTGLSLSSMTHDTDLPKGDIIPGKQHQNEVISLVGAQKACLHPDDILLLSNFVSSSESFRTTETFSPVCLPKYNAMAFLYAYVCYLDTDTCLILITQNSDAFFHRKDCRARVESFLMETHVLRDISNSVARGGLRVEDSPGDILYGSLGR